MPRENDGFQRKPCKIGKNGKKKHDAYYIPVSVDEWQAFLIIGFIAAVIGVLIGTLVKIPGVDQSTVIWVFAASFGISVPIVIYAISKYLEKRE